MEPWTYEEEHRNDERPDDMFGVIVDKMPDGSTWSVLGFQYATVHVDRVGWEHLRQMCDRALAALDKIEGK